MIPRNPQGYEFSINVTSLLRFLVLHHLSRPVFYDHSWNQPVIRPAHNSLRHLCEYGSTPVITTMCVLKGFYDVCSRMEWGFQKISIFKKSVVFMSVSVFYYFSVAFLHLEIIHDDQGSFFEIGNFTNFRQCVSSF